MNPYYSAIAERANHRCEYCHAPELVFNFPFEVEHITPLSQQGTNDESNLALACRSCNLRKGTRIAVLTMIQTVKFNFFIQDRICGVNIFRSIRRLAWLWKLLPLER
jgi:hypothetical protein